MDRVKIAILGDLRRMVHHGEVLGAERSLISGGWAWRAARWQVSFKYGDA